MNCRTSAGSPSGAAFLRPAGGHHIFPGEPVKMEGDVPFQGEVQRLLMKVSGPIRAGFGEGLATEDRSVLRQSIVNMGIRLEEKGLVVGTAGNISARLPGMNTFYVTPSGIPYAALSADDLVEVDGEGRVVGGHRRPSIEFLMHAQIMRDRADVNAVVHTHSIHATAVAAARRPLPAFLETLIAANGGPVPVAEFAPAGSPELALSAVHTLGLGAAVLLANHGVIGVGADLDQAFKVCETVEHSARVFLLSQPLGGPAGLPAEVVAGQAEFFRSHYGQRK